MGDKVAGCYIPRADFGYTAHPKPRDRRIFLLQVLFAFLERGNDEWNCTLPMNFIDAATIRKRLDWPTMIAALERALQMDIHAPVRVNHRIDVPGMPSGSLLLMPAWQAGDKIGVKIFTVMPCKE